MADLPADIVADILSRLPVKPLLRFRCVSKPWCALIDSRDFMKLHLKRSIESKTNLSLILRDYNLFSISLNTLDVPVKLDHPLKPVEFGTEVLGSCDGLILLYNDDQDACIYNPSTKKHQKLPFIEFQLPDNFNRCHCIIHGFGYDSISDDYKVVRMIQFYGEKDDTFDSEVHVYSLKSNSWRRIKDFPYYICYKRCYAKLANGALHWVVSRKHVDVDLRSTSVISHDCFIASFDLGTEEYRVVPMPKSGKKKFYISVEVLDGCLCSLHYYTDNVHVDVWIMKDYGVKESWKKLFSVAQPKHFSYLQFVVPLAYSKDGRLVLLLQDNKKLVWFDLDHDVVKEISVRGIPEYFEAEVCVQSLVPLSGGGSAIKMKKKQIQEKKQDKAGKKRCGFLSEGFKLVL